MELLTISQVAARTGFAPATLRYYEQVGLLPGLERSRSGYRLFDERSIRRLGLIARAKQLGLSLEEIRAVAQVWDRDECAPVQDRLKTLVEGRRRDALERIEQIEEFVAELDAALSELQRPAVEGACDDDCGCTAPAGDVEVPVALESRVGRAPVPDARIAIACTLDGATLGSRLAEWHDVLAGAIGRERDRKALRFSFGAHVDVAELASLAKKEQQCCSFLTFGLQIRDDEVILEVRGTDAAKAVLDDFWVLAS